MRPRPQRGSAVTLLLHDSQDVHAAAILYMEGGASLPAYCGVKAAKLEFSPKSPWSGVLEEGIVHKCAVKDGDASGRARPLVT